MMASFLSCWTNQFVLITLAILDTLIIDVSTTVTAPPGAGSLFSQRNELNDFVAPGPSVAVYPGVGSAQYCALWCSMDTECLSFFYNKLTASCDLRHDILPLGVTAASNPGSRYFALNTKCTVLPTIIPNGHPQPNSSNSVWTVGDVISVTCDAARVLYGQLRCEGGNKWNIPACEIPSCAALKACDVNAVDEEYWLFPAILQGQKVKVYCSDMTSATPKEYITLEGDNYGQSPNISNKNCEGETQSKVPNLVGESSYTKIRINLTVSDYSTRCG
ncbi:uncharacterized protein LOC121381805 [Gigantopelta aegis]|uniref:uncharacterized protein LOC121381805 n=1 Tax=Gigantopelta aegis TaxID=1735272 RepID=UPI001B88DF1C|nr:uncharacterized protein LOC121381805 [Gigantopelta aegis]